MARAPVYDKFGNRIDEYEDEFERRQNPPAPPTPERKRILIPGESGEEESDYYYEDEGPPGSRIPRTQPVQPQTPTPSPGIVPLPSSSQAPDLNTILERFRPRQQEVSSEVLQLLQQDNERRRGFEDQVRQQVLSLIQSNQQPFDPNLDPQARAFRRISERQLAANRAMQAERRAARGVGTTERGETSGALESDIATGQSQLAERIQAFESQLVAQQLQQRRSQLMDALRLGAGILSQDQSNQIRRELSQLDNELRRQLGFADIGLRGFLGGGQLSLGLLQTLLNNQLGYDRLGFDIGAFEAGLNQNAIDAIR